MNKPGPGRPKTAADKTPTTYKVDNGIKRKLAVIKAYTGRDFSDMLHEAFTDFIAKYEKEHGKIRVK